MKQSIKQYLFIISFVPMMVFAHGPSRVLVKEEATINATPEKIWSIIRDYCSIKDWHPEVTDCTSDKGSQPESVRTITLQNGEQIKEILAKHLADKFMFQHYMQDGQDIKTYPIATHSLTITVAENDAGGSILKWKGAFYRSFPGPNPPPELSDQAAQEKLASFYKTGIESIKKLVE